MIFLVLDSIETRYLTEIPNPENANLNNVVVKKWREEGIKRRKKMEVNSCALEANTMISTDVSPDVIKNGWKCMGAGTIDRERRLFYRKKLGGRTLFFSKKIRGAKTFFTTKFDNPRFHFSKKAIFEDQKVIWVGSNDSECVWYDIQQIFIKHNPPESPMAGEGRKREKFQALGMLDKKNL